MDSRGLPQAVSQTGERIEELQVPQRFHPFDFNNVIQYILKSGGEKCNPRYPKGGSAMPNWCYNKIQFADRESFERAASLLRSDGANARLSSIIKMPESVSSSYDWACKNWGTKWDAEIEIDDGEAEMTCTTAWCPPIEAFQKLAADCAAALALSYDDEQFAVVTGVVSILDDGEVYEEKCDELSMYELFQVAASVTDPDQEEYRLDPDTFKVVWRGEDADDFDGLPVVDLFDSPADKALARLRRAL